MFSKIKKVLVSLALASSLALAPMNVSAAENDGPIVGSGTDPVTDAKNTGKKVVQVPVLMGGTASDTPEYVIEVSPSLTIDLDGPSTSALDLDKSNSKPGNDGIYMKLTKADDFGALKLQVTPKFSVSDGSTKIAFTADDGAVNDKTGMTLSELGVDGSLLKFGTYDESDNLSPGTNSTSFLEADAGGDPKNVPTKVNKTSADTIRKNIPDQITDTDDSDKTSTSKPKIAADQKIGNITFDIAFVAQA